MRLINAPAAGLALVLTASAALAQAPVAPAPSATAATAPAAESDASSITAGIKAGLLVGNGFQTAYKTGVGARVGYLFPKGFYLGGAFVYHRGTSTSTWSGDYYQGMTYFGGELGFAMADGPFEIRPYAGIGVAVRRVTAPDIPYMQTGYSTTETTATIWPGVTVVYPLGSAFIGADARFVIVPSNSAFCTFLIGGMTF
jgi:hypothetical protein